MYIVFLEGEKYLIETNLEIRIPVSLEWERTFSMKYCFILAESPITFLSQAKWAIW